MVYYLHLFTKSSSLHKKVPEAQSGAWSRRPDQDMYAHLALSCWLKNVKTIYLYATIYKCEMWLHQMSNSPRVPFPKVSDRMRFHCLLSLPSSCEVDVIVQNVSGHVFYASTQPLLLISSGHIPEHNVHLNLNQAVVIIFNSKGPTFLFFHLFPKFQNNPYLQSPRAVQRYLWSFSL